MKIILLSIAMFSFTALINAQESDSKKSDKKELAPKKEKSKKKKGPITFKTLLIQRDAIPYDSQELFIFEFKNTGKTPLLIQNVQTSCGCTTADKPSEPVQPGKSSKISVKYDTKRVGDVHKTITVTTNVQSEPIVLTIQGKVLPATAAPAKTSEISPSQN
jgi:hypothetical protein